MRQDIVSMWWKTSLLKLDVAGIQNTYISTNSANTQIWKTRISAYFS